MGTQAICGECGRTLDEAYHYCPWCGVSRERETVAALVDRAVNRLDRAFRNGVDTRISEMEARLGEMEKDLNRILS